MTVPFAAKAGAFLLFVSILAGATWGVQTFLGDTIVLQAVGVEPVRGSLNATSGHTVAFAITLANRGDTPLELRVRISGDGFDGVSPLINAPGGGNATVFVPVTVAADVEPGTHALSYRVEDAAGRLLRERAAGLELRILAPSLGFEQGDSARVLYVGRVADTGRVFNTNDAVLAPMPFAKTDFYRVSTGALPVQTVPEPSVVEGFYRGMLGMQAGEWRTFTFPPEQGYGESTVREIQERRTTLERDLVLDVRTEQVDRATFDEYVSETEQGDGSSFGPGDIFRFIQGANRWPYRIVSINAETVEYELGVSVGDAFTLFPFWPEASVVTEVTAKTATFRTTPTMALERPFTYHAHWPEMTVVEDVNDASIVLRHDVRRGLKFTQAPAQFQQPREYTVAEVNDETVVVTSESTNPLAGRTLTFDVHMLEIAKG